MACFNWGTLLGEKHRHAEAVEVYETALEAGSHFAQARLNLGHQLEHLGRHEEALDARRQV